MDIELKGYKSLGNTYSARRERLKALWAQYQSQEGIAKALGVSQPIVSQWFTRHGLKIVVRRELIEEGQP